MKPVIKVLSLLVAATTAGALAAGPAAASTDDFFHCDAPDGPGLSQIDNKVKRVAAVIESCYSPVRRTTMYRGNIAEQNGKIENGDALRVGYRDWRDKGFVEHSYRSAPHDQVWNSRKGEWEVPGEWYLALNAGREIQACVDLHDDAHYRYCS